MKIAIKKSLLNSILILLFPIIGSCQNTLHDDINKFLSSYTNRQFDSLIIFQSSTLKDVSIVQANNKFDSANYQQWATIYVIQKFSNQFKIIDSTPSFITQCAGISVVLNYVSKDTLIIHFSIIHEYDDYIYILNRITNKFILSNIEGVFNTYRYGDGNHRLFEDYLYTYGVKAKKLEWYIYKYAWDKSSKTKVKKFTSMPQGIYTKLNEFQITSNYNDTPHDILFQNIK